LNGVAVDGAGNLFIADLDNHRVFKVDSVGQLTVVAGVGLSGFCGDGGPATAACLNSPIGVAVDGAGNLFIADLGNRRIRKVNAAGIITTVAGTGVAGFSGDGGPATAARLSAPGAVVLDGVGNLFIADRDNHRIRKVNAAGIITTVAGTGVFSFCGDGGPAIAACLASPTDVAVDGVGNLFITDISNVRVRKVDTAGIITTVAGTGFVGFSGDGGPATVARLWNPDGVAVDGTGNLFIADRDNHRIRKVDSTGIITTVAGNGFSSFCGDGGLAITACLRFPTGVAVSGAGNLLVVDTLNRRIRKVDTAGIITTVAGNGTTGFCGDGGPATDACMPGPLGVAANSMGDLFITDPQRIRKVDAAGTITTVAGTAVAGFSGDGGPATAARLFNPYGITADGAGNLFIADQSNRRIRKVDTAGTITTVAGTGVGGFSGDGGPATAARLFNPIDVAVDGAGNLFIADRSNHRIRKVDTSGIITTVAGTGVGGFSGDGGPATAAQLLNPFSVAVDSVGNLFIADIGNLRIRKVDSTGIITTVAGTGVAGFSGDGGPATAARLWNPVGVAVDGTGNFFIADSSNLRIRKVDPAGTITTVAGNGTFGFCGDGGPATAACLGNVWDVAVDGACNLFIADANNLRIRQVQFDEDGPLASSALATPNPVAVGTSSMLTATVTDSSDCGSVISSAEYSLDGGTFVAMTATDGTFDSATEAVKATINAFTEAGVHEVCVRGTDTAGNVGPSECLYLVAYDPSGGFVTGGGWIDSPTGAYSDDLALTGKATFGFVSKYKKGATVPTGETEFQFKAGSLNFHSAVYDWLVVAGARAQYKGVGTINGDGSYKFLLTAYDADVNKTDAIISDRFRIKIWDDEGVIYDNGLGANDFSDNQLDATPLGGGSIVIHSGKGK
jgi:sugar lactone lactonase YvrE